VVERASHRMEALVEDRAVVHQRRRVGVVGRQVHVEHERRVHVPAGVW
jgi:hypothetical protein